MGCCGQDSDTDSDPSPILQPLNSSSQTHIQNTILSPMNSNFPALVCKDVLISILEHLSVDDLARAACVSRLWKEVASDKEIQVRAFMMPWKLKQVVGKPSSGGFWREVSLGKFAISHRLAKGDSVASLAVKYSVQVTDIKRLNNMISDHGIYSRERLLIPISNPDLLIDGTCYIELDAYAKREVAVLYLEGAPDRKFNSSLNRVTSEQGKKKILNTLRRSMQVDDETAEYYYSLSNGDPRAALMEFSQDIRWERHVGLA
ncbi:hypothetical protein ACET3Z_030950 [Daucus carota]